MLLNQLTSSEPIRMVVPGGTARSSWINAVFQTISTTFAFSSLIILLLWHNSTKLIQRITNVVFSLIFRRLVLLGGKFQMHCLLNEVDELASQKAISHRNRNIWHSACAEREHSSLLFLIVIFSVLWAVSSWLLGTFTTCSKWTPTFMPHHQWTRSISSGQCRLTNPLLGPLCSYCSCWS